MTPSSGFHDVLGNAWEWSEDHYSAYHGFKVHPVYEDFSAPCFAGKHQLVSAFVSNCGSLLILNSCELPPSLVTDSASVLRPLAAQSPLYFLPSCCLQIIGGSFISTGQLASKHARYQFRPHFFQHASFRVVVPEVDLDQYDMSR